MADAGLVLRQTMTDIASAIRTKGGASGNLRPSEMAQAILSISGGGGGSGGVTAPEFLAHSDASKVLVNAYYGDYDSTTPAWGGLTVTGTPTYDVAGISVSSGTGFSYPLGEQNHDVTVYAIVRGGPDYKIPLSVVAAEENNKCPAFNVLNGNWGIISWGSDTRLSYSAAQYSVLTMAIDTQNGTAKFYVNGTAQGDKPVVASGDTVRFNGSLNHGSRHYTGNFQYLYIGVVDGCEDGATILANQVDLLPLAQNGLIGIPSSGGGGSTKYGVPIDFFLGDPNANGVLQKPSVDAVAIDLGATVVDIAQEVLANKFQGLTRVRSFTAPALTQITGYRACYYMCQGCTGLTSVSFPELVDIGRAGLCHAFDGCTALTSASFPKVKRVSDLWGLQSAFAGCNNLTAIDFSLLESVADEGLGNAFNNCTRLASISFLALTSVGVKGFSYAFQYAPIANVYFPSIQSLPNSRTFEFAFNENSALQEVSFPNLESIGADRTFDNAFSKSTSTGALRALFPKLKTITSYAGFYHAFWGRKGLSEIDFSVLETVNAGEVFDEAFRYCNALTSVSFPALVSAAGQNCFRVAFQNCTGLTQISFPLLETVNGAGSFRGFLYGCTALTAISLPSLQTITGDEAFYEFASGATSITSATFPSLTTVNGNSSLFRLFYGCTHLVSLSFPALASIKGTNALGGMMNGCTALTTISFPALTTVATANALSNAFTGSSITEAHFRADMQATIEALTNYSTCFGRGAGTVTFYFDL